MNNHLSISVSGTPLSLPQSDFSIDIDFNNPLFNDADKFSYPVQIPLDGNRFLVQNLDDPHSSIRPVNLEDRPTRIFTEGFPFFDGNLKTSDDEEVSDSLSINIDGGKTLSDLISDLECQDIPVKDSIVIGEKISTITAKGSGSTSVCPSVTGTTNIKVKKYRRVDDEAGAFDHWEYIGEESHQCSISSSDFTVNESPTVISTFSPQALGFSVPAKYTAQIQGNVGSDNVSYSDTDGRDENDNPYTHATPKNAPLRSYINVSVPYGETETFADGTTRTAYYCNSRIAYKHHPLDKDGNTDTNAVVDGDPYMVLDADRPQSGICFYILYFLDCLFAHLNVEWDNSALLAIEDMKRLCFFTTKCEYDEDVKKTQSATGFSYLNQWLRYRGCDARLSYKREDSNEVSYQEIPSGTKIAFTTVLYLKVEDYYGSYSEALTYKIEGTTLSKIVLSKDNKSQFSLRIDSISLVSHFDPTIEEVRREYNYETLLKEGDTITVNIKTLAITAKWDSFSLNSVSYDYAEMLANSKNFPDASVSDILSSLENMFGIRFIYEAEKHKVTARLLRDIYRDNSAPIDFRGTVHEMHKLSEKITGVKVMYSAESDYKEQRNNLRDQTRDYDTEFDYIDYPNPSDKPGIAGSARARTTDITKTYAQFPRPTSTDNVCYIDQQTGNAYRIKIDSDASSPTDMKPVRFEVGAFKGAEFGDCSQSNADFIKELSTSFEPVRLSCVNPDAVYLGQAPLLVPFADDDMEHEYLLQSLAYPFNSDVGNIKVVAHLNLKENYDVSSSDSGNSPLQSHDWGTCIAIMRGGGTDSTVQQYDYNFDGFGNSKWRTTVGNYALSADSIDFLGNEYDYNGSGTVQGGSSNVGSVQGGSSNVGSVQGGSAADNGVGRGERFSLKPRAYKQPSWASSPLCRDDEHSESEGFYYIRNRGYADRFLSEHANFLLNRRKFIVRAECEAAFIADIPNHWFSRWRINGEIGYINKVSTSLSIDQGIGEVEIEFFAI